MSQSTMYAVRPVPFGPSTLTSSTATEAVAAYNPATTYTDGAQVRLDSTGRIYTSTQASNTGNPPDTSPLWWVDTAPANRLAMFDARISTQTAAASPLVVVLTPGALCTNLALLNLAGNTAQAEVLVGGSVVYSKTISLQGAQIADWMAYYFAPDEQITVALFDDLPLYAAPQIRITITGSGTVAVGHCVFGSRQDLGDLQYGANAALVDYSRKETDEFGGTTFVQRDYADEFSGQLLIDNGQINSVKRTLRRLRATPTLFVGTSDTRFAELFIAFGWVRTHRIAVSNPTHSLIDLEIGALT